MKIIVNGKEQDFNQPLNISNLLEKLNIREKIIVVELNLEIINKTDYETTWLKDSDSVEIVGFAGGG